MVAFLDGPTLFPSEQASTPEPQRPKKRRKLTGRNTSKTPLHSIDSDDFLTLARVDISIAFRKSLSESIWSPSPDENDSEHQVLLERFTERTAGEYSCRITTVPGVALFDEVIRSRIDPQTLEVLQIAINPRGRRQRKNLLKSNFTLSKSLGYDHGAKTSGFQDNACSYTLDLCIRILVPNARALSGSIGISRNDILDVCAPESIPEKTDSWSPRDFYDNVHVPKSDGMAPDVPPIDQLKCELYPFQKRAVQWLLWREGAVEAHEPPQELTELSHGFVRTTDGDGRHCLVSHFWGMTTTDEQVPVHMSSEPKGGILAEEMGLGKTVEMIALICLHKRDPAPQSPSPKTFQRCSATLVITPPAILQQWKNELRGLAPSLSVFTYEGLRVEAGKSDHEALLSRCTQHDVILTTYNVLAREIHYAETPNRSLRHAKRYEERLSPLTQIHWWRVVLDEAQMVAKLIPRDIAWCVSGTPVKKDARDLFGLVDFLCYKPYCDFPAHVWERLVTQHKTLFRRIFRTLALRHTKDQIKDDLRLPPQRRVVVTVPFSQIEEQHYSTMFGQMAEDCGLNLDGTPRTDDWNPDSSTTIEKMRNWLIRLRQTCLHPEVGARNRRALGGKGPLRTVREVLEVMIEQNNTAARTEERLLLLSQARRGQILEHAEQSEEALQIWLHTLEDAKLIVYDCREQLQAEIDRLGLTGEAIREAEEIEAAIVIRTGPHRQRLRAAIEIEHMCTFFVANAYYQIKTDKARTKADSNEYYELQRKEESTYQRAKLLRRELLREAHDKAETLMSRVNGRVDANSMVNIPQISPLKSGGGIESRRICDRLNKIISIMQSQATQIEEWRDKTTKLLLLTLVDEEETDLQGDEYETSTKQQDEVYVYVDALRALIADRHDILTGQDNELIKHEMGVAFRQAKEGQGHSPELLLKLLSIRNRLKPTKDVGSVRGMITELREIKTTLRGATEKGISRAAAELLIVNGALENLHQISTEQTKTVAGLDREIELFKDTMNLRLDYYRQLQQISDTVAPYEEDLREEARKIILLDRMASESHTKARITTLKSKGRYLVHLRDEATNVESQRLCIICQQPFEVGILTSCGHSYCVECLRLWWASHRNCPTCKKHLTRNDFHQITYKPQQLTMEEEGQAREKEMRMANGKEESVIYSGIRDHVLHQIKNIDLDGSFGTKIDTIARHILWIREHDPGAKSIVFSQYRDFLDVLARAFAQFRIDFTGIDRKDGIERFQNDPSKECFFLHAKARSSGLNLVNATHVFLCEPLINTAIELQAIARVHRIGQHQPTTVWMYIVEDTVEKSIYDISVTRRLAHMGRSSGHVKRGEDASLENQIDAANTKEVEESALGNLLAKASSGGEVVGKEDLWNCLFLQKPGHTRYSEEAEREVLRHVGATAAEARLDLDRQLTNSI
ncbi:MAG: hypothetical protein ALECFALPRED_007533 [Alectoria fallacina]|uniref:Uncharacterized protein n=1 Tax=Alectoria fallacina TaxID=1903189 RepID=A0A8H3I250_9LECA|nr:MAG: hypothetical protein ALECFALPRED_007533 [Alectoria fallacina]